MQKKKCEILHKYLEFLFYFKLVLKRKYDNSVSICVPGNNSHLEFYPYNMMECASLLIYVNGSTPIGIGISSAGIRLVLGHKSA